MKSTKPIAVLLALAASASAGHASIAYGTLNNFDTVNDTGHECHGFEIELEDLHGSDIAHTYNYNHYGVAKIEEDLSDAAHPVAIVRWESAKNADGSWAAFTAIPSGPIDPTNGHQFTNPNVNFGGEHFGVGYRQAPTAVRYYWLIDDGGGNLSHSDPVQVCTPQWYVSGGRVGARVEAPEPPEVHIKEFGPAIWVKEICTTSHNSHEIELRDLVSDDPDDDDERNWRNGEPDEVEVEWHILQVEYADDEGGGNGEFDGAPEDLEDGDEVVTRRFEFYEYVGPLDVESGEAKADNVGADELHGDGVKEINDVEVDLSGVVVVGEYLGAQMAAFDAEAGLSLVEQLQAGEVGTAYPSRLVVVPGPLAFTAEVVGDLPDGLNFDDGSGILSGTPTTAGEFTFRIEATEDGADAPVGRNYTIVVAEAGAELPPLGLVDTNALPYGGGSTSGDGAYAIGQVAPLVAEPAPGYEFVGWEEKGQIVSEQAALLLTVDVNHSLVATFAVASYAVTADSNDPSAGTASGGGDFADGAPVALTAAPAAGQVFVNWTEGGSQVSDAATYTFDAAADRVLVANFMPEGGETRALSVAAPAGGGGTVLGSGTYIAGSEVTVRAHPEPGYIFVRWLAGGSTFSTDPAHAFALDAPVDLSAEFALIIPEVAMGHDPAGGIRIEWPADLPGWVLEEATGGLDESSWSASTAPVQTDGATRRATVEPGAARAFYRLTHP